MGESTEGYRRRVPAVLYSRPGKRHHIQGEETEQEEEDGQRGEGGKLQCCSTLLATAGADKCCPPRSKCKRTGLPVTIIARASVRNANAATHSRTDSEKRRRGEEEEEEAEGGGRGGRGLGSALAKNCGFKAGPRGTGHSEACGGLWMPPGNSGDLWGPPLRGPLVTCGGYRFRPGPGAGSVIISSDEGGGEVLIASQG